MGKRDSQCNRILVWLQSGRTLTRAQAARELNCYCLPERIRDLRRKGYAIKTTKVVHNGKHFAKYSMEVNK